MTRRTFAARCLQFLAAGGLFSLIWNFIHGKDAPDLVVSFHYRPHKGEIVFDRGVYLVGLEQDVRALSQRCPHLGCSLVYNKKASQFQCPCHGSRFSPEGLRVEGPARKNMLDLKLTVDDKCGVYTAKLPIL